MHGKKSDAPPLELVREPPLPRRKSAKTTTACGTAGVNPPADGVESYYKSSSVPLCSALILAEISSAGPRLRFPAGQETRTKKRGDRDYSTRNPPAES